MTCVCDAGYSCPNGSSTCQLAYAGLVWNTPPTPAQSSLSNATAVRLEAQLTPTTGLQPFTPPSTVTLSMRVGAAAPTTMPMPALPDGGGYSVLLSTAPEGQLAVMASFDVLDSGTRIFSIDRTPPTLSVALEATPPRDAGWLNPATWRRDERPHVLMTANEGLQAGSLSMSLASSAVTPLGIAECADAGLVCPGAASDCLCGRLDLARPPLQALSGSFAVTGSATDLAGNARTSQSLITLPVTRVRWERNTMSFSHTSVALDQNGNLAVAGSSLTSIDPFGGTRFTVQGAVGGGTFNGVAIDNANGLLYFSEFRPSMGPPFNTPERGYLGAVFSNNGVAQGTIQIRQRGWTAPALISPDGTAATTRGVAFGSDLSNTDGVAWKPGVASPPIVTVAVGQGLRGVDYETYPPTIVRGTGVHFITPGTLWQRFFNGMAWSGTGSNSILGIQGAAATAIVVGASMNTSPGVWANGTSGPTPPFNAASQPVFRNDTTLVVAVGSTLKSVAVGSSLVATDITSVTPNETTHGAPVLGMPVPGSSVESIYAVTSAGRLIAHENGATWHAPLFTDGTGTVIASPNLDCNRLQSEAGRPGVLYVIKDNARLIAVLVDAPKLSTTSPWPKYQKDAANSGNTDTGLFPRNPGCP